MICNVRMEPDAVWCGLEEGHAGVHRATVSVPTVDPETGEQAGSGTVSYAWGP